MADSRYLFGSGAGDFAIAPPSRHGGFLVAATSVSNGTFWSDRTGGTQYTDLQTVDGGVTSTVSTDKDGSVVPFYGPAGVYDGWLDFGQGGRVYVVGAGSIVTAVANAQSQSQALAASAAASATSAQQAAAAAFQPTDSAVASAIGGTATQARAAIDDLTERRKLIDANKCGVKADGVTNDAAAWNALVASCSPGDVITWTGRSMLDDRIIWKSGVSLRGQGWGRSILATRDTTGTRYFSAIEFTPSNGGASASNMLVGCTFADFEVDGSGLSGPGPNIGGKAIFTQYTRQCQFRNLYLHDTIGTALGTDFMPDCLIDGLLVVNGGRGWDGAAGGHAGIGVGMGAFPQENVTISNCNVVNSKHYGIFVEYQAGSPYRSAGAKIIGNSVTGSQAEGINDRGCDRTQIIGNSVTGCGGNGISASYSATNGLIMGNTTTGNALDGIQLLNDIGTGWRIQGNKSSGNRRGILINGGSTAGNGVVVAENDCQGNSMAGIAATGGIGATAALKSLVIAGNRVYNNCTGGTETRGILIDGSPTGFVIAHNRCYDNQTTQTQVVGIGFSASASNTLTDGRVSGNNLVGNKSLGMDLGAAVRTNVDLRANTGAGLENRGTGTIAAGSATVNIPHGCSPQPTRVFVTPKSNELVWVDTIGVSGVIYRRAVTTNAVDFSWSVEV